MGKEWEEGGGVRNSGAVGGGMYVAVGARMGRNQDGGVEVSLGVLRRFEVIENMFPHG